MTKSLLLELAQDPTLIKGIHESLVGIDRSLDGLAVMADDDQDPRLELLQNRWHRLRSEVERRFPEARGSDWITRKGDVSRRVNVDNPSVDLSPWPQWTSESRPLIYTSKPASTETEDAKVVDLRVRL